MAKQPLPLPFVEVVRIVKGGSLKSEAGMWTICSACAGVSINEVCLAAAVFDADGLIASHSCPSSAAGVRLDGMMKR